MKSFIKLLAFMMVTPLFFSSCGDSKNDEPEPEVKPISIIGKWITASSTANTWAVYEFTNEARLNVETREDNKITEWSGFYSIDSDNLVTGSVASNDLVQKHRYIDWKLIERKNFQVNIEVYDNNQLVGRESLYAMLGSTDVAGGETVTPKYRDFCGSDNYNNFSSLDTEIATVEPTTGAITGLKRGTTFIMFITPNGRCAIKVNITSTPKTFAENIIGTWIYDNTTDKEWQKTKFVPADYVYVEFSPTGNIARKQTAEGTYKIDKNDILTFSVVTSGNLKMNQEYRTESIGEYDWKYACYSDGANVGTYTVHRLLDTLTLKVSETATPDYNKLLDGLEPIGFESHKPNWVEVSEGGVITAKAKGTTYVEVKTVSGTGYIEVTVES